MARPACASRGSPPQPASPATGRAPHVASRGRSSRGFSRSRSSRGFSRSRSWRSRPGHLGSSRRLLPRRHGSVLRGFSRSLFRGWSCALPGGCSGCGAAADAEARPLRSTAGPPALLTPSRTCWTPPRPPCLPAEPCVPAWPARSAFFSFFSFSFFSEPRGAMSTCRDQGCKTSRYIYIHTK